MHEFNLHDKGECNLWVSIRKFLQMRMSLHMVCKSWHKEECVIELGLQACRSEGNIGGSESKIG